jgi:hypothetical protein
MSNFRHELFHNLQRSINQNSGGDGNVNGAEHAWQFFSEGTAVLASSVGPAEELSTWHAPAYMLHANPFIGYSVLFTDLNRSYEEIIPYRAAMYWRFLYEQCGGTEDSSPNSAAGMQVIRRALTILYSGDVVDIDTSTDLVEALPEIMDRSLSASSCPFDTHAESLAAFARAIYALQLEDGRCEAPGSPAGCGLYDPHNLYSEPPVSTINGSEAHQGYAGEVPSSFGADFVDIVLDPVADGRPMTLDFHTAPGAASQFNVQVWKLGNAGEGSRPRPTSLNGGNPETLTTRNPEGGLSYVIPAVDTTQVNRLGLIITRIDADESLDPVGAYTIELRPVESD